MMMLVLQEKPKLDKTDTLSQGRKDFNGDTWSHQSSSEDEASTDMSSVDGQKASTISLGSTSDDDDDDDVEIKRPYSSYWHVPPPYLKQKTNKGENNLKVKTMAILL